MRVIHALLPTLLLAACGTGADEPDLAASDEATLTLTPAEAAGLLRLVNDCATTRDVMRVEARVVASAATAISDWRAGADAACGTADDRRFATVEALDDVPGVGDATLRALLAFARVRGLVVEGDAPIGSFDGVLFTEVEARGALALANVADASTLDGEVGLDSRAAQRIVAARPFRTDDLVQGLVALSAVPYVGAAALLALKIHGADYLGESPPALTCQELGGTFSGVEFTPVQAHDVVDFANRGDVTGVAGIGQVLSERIQRARPFQTVTDLDAVSGVGPAVLKAMRDTVATAWCRHVSARCGCAQNEAPGVDLTVEGVTFPAAVVPHALDLLQRAGRYQLEADGKYEAAEAAVIINGRPWASVRAYADTRGVGTGALRRLLDYATNGLWQGPGPMRSAITVSQLMAEPQRFPRNSVVSMERVSVRYARFDESRNVFSMTLADDERAGSPSVRLTLFLCGHDSCWSAPDIRAGQWLTLVHADVAGVDSRGRPFLYTRPNTRIEVLP